MPKDDDLFVTSEVSRILDLSSNMREFVDDMWLGFSILRKNYASVIQAFRLVLADWHIHIPENEVKLDILYQKFMIGEEENTVKDKLIELCEASTKKSMISSEKLSFIDEG